MGKLLVLRDLNTKCQHPFPSKACALARKYQNPRVQRDHTQRWVTGFSWKNRVESVTGAEYPNPRCGGRVELHSPRFWWKLFPLGSVCGETARSTAPSTFALLNCALCSWGNLSPDGRNNEISSVLLCGRACRFQLALRTRLAIRWFLILST